VKLYDANIDFSMFALIAAKNTILELETAALRVTEKNIGTLAIHLGTDLLYANGVPYISIACSRVDGMGGHVAQTFWVSDVIVFLNDEIHRFSKKIFEHTFVTDEVVEYRCTICGKISGDSVDGAYGEKHVAYEIATIPGIPQRVLQDCNMNEKI